VKAPARPPQTPKKKKPYTPPRLTVHGKFHDIVQGARGNKQDPGQGNRSRQ
jgi:hypothetical protein